MERRTLLSTLVSSFLSESPERPADTPDNPYANKTLPNVRRTAAGLEPYTGPWTVDEVLHLLRRTTFGPSPDHVASLAPLSLSQALDQLFAAQPVEVSQPLIVDARDLAPIGQTWVNLPYKSSDPTVTFNPIGIRTNSLKAWWTGLMLNQTLSLREKMTLFWHNHFVTEVSTVADPRYSYYYLALLRANALGNFKSLTRQVSVDGAMLRYLNGNTNTKASPNENYGRELQELFTIGKGPEVALSDYTYYTEQDVQAAAHVLTGWKDIQNADKSVGPVTSTFVAANHDPADKQFSARYGNTVIQGGATAADGPRELDALIDMIFSQDETAKFFSRQLYRWFVYYVIDDAAETNVIAPLAAILRGNNYDVAPALRTLLGSAHFFDPVNRGCTIKSPLDHLVGLCRQGQVAFPSDTVKLYTMWTYLWNVAAAMDMNPGDPPNVAGWPAYYQTPEFNELWVNTDTLPKRSNLSTLLATKGYSTAGAVIAIDPIALVQTVSNPTDPNVVINEWAQHLFAVPLTDNQKAFLKEVLIPGLPDYEWAAEWTTYLADPTNATKKAAVKSKLQAMLSFMMSMPEYQLE
ncbi:MAG TPA: DUF1800 domain-containing protein [Bacteroidota bacterium]